LVLIIQIALDQKHICALNWTMAQSVSLWRWNKSIPRYIVYTATRNNRQFYFTFVYNKDNCKYVHFKFENVDKYQHCSKVDTLVEASHL